MEVKPGYKQTEVGVIPEDWDAASLLRVAQCLDNVRVPINESQRMRMQGDIPYCGANGVLGFVDGYVIDDDIILMAEDGGYFDEYESRPIAYRMKGKCWVNNHAHILKAKPGYDQGFLFYSLVHKNIMPFLASGTRAKLNKSEMVKILVPAPPSETEQRAIATALSDVDGLLGRLDRLIAKKRDLKQAAMQQLLTGQTRLPGFGGAWEVKCLGEIASLRRDHVVPASFPEQIFVHFSLPAFDDGMKPVLERGSEIGSNKFRIPKDAVLVSKLNPRIPRVWAPEHIPDQAVASTEFLLLVPKDRVSRGFLFVCCTSPYFCERMELAATGTTGSHQRISPSVALSIAISLPTDVNEQTAIATVLSDMDAELATLAARRDKTRALKQAMMQELLTGRTRLV
ncbi:MAG: restriction endonuclease subunit S [Chromatiaceae bacterium]|nr:restriction endonuclease subunit S [Chromatiaceae bacterium]